jgi:hypothetical protein
VSGTLLGYRSPAEGLTELTDAFHKPDFTTPLVFCLRKRTFFETVPAIISASQRPTSAIVLESHLNNQNLICAKSVSIGDQLVKNKKRGEIYFSTSTSHKIPFTIKN